MHAPGCPHLRAVDPAADAIVAGESEGRLARGSDVPLFPNFYFSVGSDPGRVGMVAWHYSRIPPRMGFDDKLRLWVRSAVFENSFLDRDLFILFRRMGCSWVAGRRRSIDLGGPCLLKS